MRQRGTVSAAETFSRRELAAAIGLIASIAAAVTGIAALSRSAAALADARMLVTDIMLVMPSSAAVL